MKNTCYTVFASFIIACVCLGTVQAREPIEVKVTVLGNDSSSGFKSIDSMTDGLAIDPISLFGAGFDINNTSTAFTATIDLLGFQMDLDVVGNDLTLSFTTVEGTRVSHVLNGDTRTGMFDLLEDFFRSDAGQAVFDEYARALQSQAVFNFISGAQSSVGESVRENTLRAMGESLTLLEMRRRKGDESNFSIGYEYTEFENEFFSGESTTVPIQIGTRLNQVADLQFRLPINWTDLDGTEFYRVGMELDLGLKLVGHQPQAPFEWEVTPTVGNYIVGTSDMVMGGDIYNYGLQNRLQWNTAAASISYGAYWGQYKSTSVSWDDLDIDLQVDEEILSHGAKVAFRIGQNAVIDVYAIQSRPHSGIGYREVHTLGATFNYRLGALVLQVGYAEDEGQDDANAQYEAERWLANLLFRF